MSKDIQIEDLREKLKQKSNDVQELEKILQKSLDKVASLELINATLSYEAKTLEKQLQQIIKEKEDEQISMIVQAQTRRNSLNAT